MKEETLLRVVEREFRALRRLADSALARIDDDEFFREPAEGANSAAVLVKHVAGNQRSRWRDFLTTDGDKPDRDRDDEFEIGPGDTRQSLAARWDDGWTCLFDALEGLSEADLARTVRIRGEPHSVLQAIHRQLTHYAYHVGQIVLVARGFRGGDWESLSVARGGSREFNRAPRSYLEDA